MTIITRFLPQDIGEARRSDYCFGSERRDDFFEARITAERTRGLAYVKLQPSHQLRLDETARQAEDRAQPPTPAKEVRNQIKLWPKQRICRAPHLRKMMSARTSLANPTKSTMKTAVPESLSFAAVGDAWKKRSPNLTRFAERPLRPPSPARSTSDRARD